MSFIYANQEILSNSSMDNISSYDEKHYNWVKGDGIEMIEIKHL